MAIGNPFNGDNSEHYYVEEAAVGVTPVSPTWIKIRNTGGIPQLIKEALTSNELDNSREITDITGGNEQTNGEYAIELSNASQDDLIANAKSSSWVDGIAQAGVEITVSDAGKTYTRSTGDFLADGVVAGDLTHFPGLTGNNAEPFFATSVTATVITGGGITLTLVDETVTTDYVTGDKIGTGSECKTVSILSWLKGKCGTVDKYLLTTGVEFTGFSLEIGVNAKVTGSFPFIGRQMSFPAAPPAGSTFTTNSTAKTFSGLNGKVLVDDVPAAFITSVTVSNDNAASAQFVLGDKNVKFVERGKATNTVSLASFFCDTELMQKFAAEVNASIAVIVSNQSGAMGFSWPTTYLSAVTPEIGGPTSATETIEGSAFGSATQSSLIIQRITF